MNATCLGGQTTASRVSCFTAKSRFNILISGTLFPLGPSTDAAALPRTLGGPFEGDQEYRWSPQLRTAQCRLLGDGKLNKAEHHLLALRKFSVPFNLRRTTSWKVPESFV